MTISNRKLQNILTDIYTEQWALNQGAIAAYKSGIGEQISANEDALGKLSKVQGFSENEFYQQKSVEVQNTIAALLQKSELVDYISQDDVIKNYLLSKQDQISHIYQQAETKFADGKKQKIISLHDLKDTFPKDEEVIKNADNDIVKIGEEVLDQNSVKKSNISVAELQDHIKYILNPLGENQQSVEVTSNGKSMKQLEELDSNDVSKNMKGFFNIAMYLAYADELKAVNDLYDDCKHIDPKMFSMSELQTKPTSKKEWQRRMRIRKNFQKAKNWTILFMKNRKGAKEISSDIEAVRSKLEAMENVNMDDEKAMSMIMEQFAWMHISVERMSDIKLMARNIQHATVFFATMMGHHDPKKKNKKAQQIENEIHDLLVPILENLPSWEWTEETIEWVSDTIYQKISPILPSVGWDLMFSRLLVWCYFLDLALTTAERNTGIDSSNKSALLKTYIEDFVSAHLKQLWNAKINEQWHMMKRFEYIIWEKKDNWKDIVKNKEEYVQDSAHPKEPEEMLGFISACQEWLSEFKYISNHALGCMNLGKKVKGLIDERKIEENDTDAWKEIADLYFSQIQWDEVPYDSPIVFANDSLVTTQAYDNLMEVNFINNPKYKGVISIGTLQEFLEFEDSTNLLHSTMNISHKEAKNIIKKGMFLENDAYLQIGEFAKFLKVIVFADGSLGINGFNSDSALFMIGDKIYEPLRAYIFKYILECTKVIDRREIKEPKDLLATYKEQNNKDYYFKDPRLLYNNNDTVIPAHTKNVEFRESHRRLLHEKMIPWPKWWKNARHVDEPLYAYVYDRDSDMEVEKPLESIRIDNIAEDYSKFVEQVVALKAKHNTNLTVIRFQTFVQEFNKDEGAAKKLKVLQVVNE